LKAVLKFLDETDRTLVEARSGLRAIAEDRRAGFRSELEIADPLRRR